MKHYGEDLLTPEVLDAALEAITQEFDSKFHNTDSYARRLDTVTADSLDVLSKKIQSLRLALISVFALNVATTCLVIYLLSK